ncbi:FAD-dependent monooxygenase [Nitrospirillum viridazoti]|uniref:2-polyprenyl-6-methoxyphenol hydroxylase n=1 Tax=Nitrospirillum viridazoti CBAmc TaxID=1441467 RepID=A0A248JUM9_9PROT|nr:FAD-dependent monooxygenase [Nitrospirillum amazonense]ASG22405.1 2-polyprenyl-6-methoxyphenol hydroxylase [Nitrospirillum amazonense CBAmc]TWB43061.1 2-polyprenyl-6-methoxyphenol hydroxylase-like FAD-dependent oxidoreductase [Nitrospirillum amazonense]
MASLRIRIVGGSIGGLSAAALLRQDGHDVRIYERSAAGLAGRGAGLVSQRELFALLRAVGCEHVARIGVVAFERIYFDRDGGIAERHATPQTQISWDHLYRTLRAKVPDDGYVLDRAVRAVTQGPQGARLLFGDGGEEEADLVIGADGLGSVVRPVVTGGPAPNSYAGYVAWRGLYPEDRLPAEAALLRDRFAFYTMPRSHALGYLVPGPGGETTPGQRRYNWVWYRPVPAAALEATLTDAEGRPHPHSLAPGQVRAQAAAALRADAARLLPPPFAAVVVAEPQPFIQAIFDYEAPVMAAGHVALLGDAAFVARPHTAMGVAKAAGDAMALRRHLAEAPSVTDALALYSHERCAAGSAITAYGRRLGAALE